MKNRNPFPLNNYIGSKYFCNRVMETERIISAVTNKRNIILISENGIGKTTLIKHVAEELNELDSYVFVYVPLMKAEKPAQLIKKFFNAAFLNKNLKKEINNNFSDLSRIKKYIISENSNHAFVKETDYGELLQKIFYFFETTNEKLVVAFDDFQNAFRCLSKKDVKTLLNIIAQSRNISFILSLNNHYVFDKNTEEILGKTEIINLEKIERKKYFGFIKKRFKKENRKITKESINYILKWANLSTFYVQYICNKLYDTNENKITVDLVDKTINNILEKYEFIFLNYKQLLSPYQWKLLVAIATEGKAIKITSSSFIEKYELNAASSVKTAITALIEKELIARKEKSYHIINVFLEKWLSENN